MQQQSSQMEMEAMREELDSARQVRGRGCLVAYVPYVCGHTMRVSGQAWRASGWMHGGAGRGSHQRKELDTKGAAPGVWVCRLGSAPTDCYRRVVCPYEGAWEAGPGAGLGAWPRPSVSPGSVDALALSSAATCPLPAP